MAGGPNMRTTKIVTMSLPPQMAEKIDKITKKEYRSRSEILREALRDYLKRHSDEEED